MIDWHQFGGCHLNDNGSTHITTTNNNNNVGACTRAHGAQFVTQPVMVNLVAGMRARNATMATHKVETEYWEFAWGMPELARYGSRQA